MTPYTTFKRKTRNALTCLYLNVRQFSLSKKRVENLYIATVQKTGSQWVKALLNDSEIRALTKLKRFPQHRYEFNEFKARFPRGTFVPGLYVSYDLYEEIHKPRNFKVCYVMRDPRDIIVSWYFSMRDTHGEMGKVKKYREDLKKLDLDAGLHYCIEAFSMKLMAMRTWANNQHDPNLIILKFEELTQNPAIELRRLLDFMNVEHHQCDIEKIVKNYSKETMRNKDILKRNSEKSHYRSDNSGYRKYFNNSHHIHFRNVTGDLLEKLNYPAETIVGHQQ